MREEVVQRLGMTDAHVLTHGFDRPNIHLAVRRHEDDHGKRAAVLDDVESLKKPGLLYVATRKDTEVYAEALRERGIRAEAYHAGLSAKRRREMHAAFHEGEYDVVVATSAFGHGHRQARHPLRGPRRDPRVARRLLPGARQAGRDGEPPPRSCTTGRRTSASASFFASTAPKRGDLRRFHAAAQSTRTLADVAEAMEVSVRRATDALANLLARRGRRGARRPRRAAAEPDADRAAEPRSRPPSRGGASTSRGSR